MLANTTSWAAALCCASWLALATSASAQNPDVITYDIGVNGSDTNDIAYYGQSGGIAAYSIGTQSCNKGTTTVEWITAGGSTHHPVIGQNMFRYKDGHFEHIGQSWLKHGFCAVNEIETFCAPCHNTPCDSLGIGCADTYWATLNDGGGGQSKVNINAATGGHIHAGAPTGNATIRGRLQVAVSDIDPAQNPGAQYFIEGQYVTQDDAAAGNAGNNASWRKVNVLAVNNIDGGGVTHREEPAIFAWQDLDRDVKVREVKNVENAGTKTTFLLGYRASDLGGGIWHYEYAIQNLTSDQSAGSFVVPVPTAVNVTNIGFHDVNYHSGDPYDGTDWPGAKSAGVVSWATTPFATNANANAIRWGTLYNFWFDAASAPTTGPVTIGLFKPSVNTSQSVDNVLVPGDPRTPPPVGGPSVFANHGGAGSATMAPTTVTVPRFGSKMNALVLSEGAPALLGHAWRGALEVSGARRSMLLVGLGGPSEGTFNRMGEMLVAPPIVRGKVDDLSFAIPDDAHLLGVTFSAQAAVLTQEGWRLTNALDVTIGSN